MNNKGFTLVELLGVIIILTVIFSLVFPAVENIIFDSEETTYQKQINTILNASYDWSLKNSTLLPERGNKIYITLSELKHYGLIEDNITNPKTKEIFPDDLVISISNVGGNYKYNNKNSKQGGDYLYTVELELIGTEDYKTNKPTIVLADLISTSDGEYVTEINVGTEFNSASYTSTSKDSIDLTDKVVVNITCNDNMVDTINTEKANIYHINYTVVDSNGYATTVVRKVIVVDNEAPTIVLPENNTISSSLTSYDLKNGVTCTDNSNKCTITTKGSLTFGTLGKYVIEYIVKDPSGNTTTQKRVITIE